MTSVDVAIVGAGVAGCALATRLARRGVEVVVLERAPAWRWRAGGVFSSPATVGALARLGVDLDPDGTQPGVGRPPGDGDGAGGPPVDGGPPESLARPIPAMRLETPGGTTARLTYGTESGGPPAVGFDRVRLDGALERLALQTGATVRRGIRVSRLDRDGSDMLLSGQWSDGREEWLRARIVVGADGPHSMVARTLAVDRPVRLGRRVGLSYHVADPRARPPASGMGPDARLYLFRDGYVGLAPVPYGRLNVGIVLAGPWLDRLAREGAEATARAVLRAVPTAGDDPTDWADAVPCDPISGAAPLGGRVTRAAGPGWFLVGDAAGFLDPVTGEGLHRAVLTAELAAPAIVAGLGRRGGDDTRGEGAAAYRRALRRRFATKDLVSWVVQVVLARPALLEVAVRRLAERPDLRATMGLVMGDLVPASRALDPRFLGALLRP